MAYRLTDWTPLTDQDAEVRHLVEVEDGYEWDGDDIIATYCRTEIGERLADAALALVNGDAGLTGTLPPVVPAAPRVHTIIVNGQAIEVPRGEHDHVYGVAERAVDMAGYGDIITRPWEVKDAEGRSLGYKDDPDAIRHISLRAGTAS